jgi:hypothetical protein
MLRLTAEELSRVQDLFAACCRDGSAAIFCKSDTLDAGA